MKPTKWVLVRQVAFRTIAVWVLESSKEAMTTEAENYAFEEGEFGWELDEVKATDIKDSLTKEFCRRHDIEMFEMDASDKQDPADKEAP